MLGTVDQVDEDDDGRGGDADRVLAEIWIYLSREDSRLRQNW